MYIYIYIYTLFFTASWLLFLFFQSSIFIDAYFSVNICFLSVFLCQSQSHDYCMKMKPMGAVGFHYSVKKFIIDRYTSRLENDAIKVTNSV